MLSPSFASVVRKIGFGFLLLYAGLLLVTSGPRSVQGLVGVDESAETAGQSDGVRDGAVAPADDPPAVMWDVLAGLDYRTGEIGPELSPFVDKEVRIPGFMIPLEDWADEVSEFLLVPYVGACVHTPPPPPNQLVYVKMKNDTGVAVSFWDPVWIHGTLAVEETTNQYGSVSFTLQGTAVKPYQFDR